MLCICTCIRYSPMQIVHNHLCVTVGCAYATIHANLTPCMSAGKLKLHPGALQATSFGAAIAGASLLKSPLYLHLANTYFPETQKFTMPTPVVSILTGGHLGCGKLKMREFCLVPLPGVTFPEQIRSLVTVYQEMGKVLTAKSGVSSQYQ